MTTKSKKAAKAETSNVYVYLGPSIRGVIQNGTIYHGGRSEIVETLKDAIDQYPMIERLIIKDVDVAAAKRKIRSGESALSIAYKRLLAG